VRGACAGSGIVPSTVRTYWPTMASEQHLGAESPHRLPLPVSLPAVPAPDPSVMKLTRGHSCVLCQQRKVRCDKQKPCANCVKASVECRVVPPLPPRRRKKKPHERDLIDRLRKYEHLLSQHGVNFDPIAQDLRPSDHPDDVADLEQDLSGLKTSPSSAADQASPEQGQERQTLSSFDSCISANRRLAGRDGIPTTKR